MITILALTIANIVLDAYNSSMQARKLIDNFGRQVTYLRVSVTDRCDFRCRYCMDEEMTFLPRKHLLTYEEIVRITAAFANLGVNKVRVTGGEPLTRHGIDLLFKQLGQLEPIKDLTLTTNGSQLHRYAEKLKAHGVTRINISLDTLSAERFKDLTRTGKLAETLQGIQAAVDCGFKRLKINAVIMRGSNEDEIIPLLNYAIQNNMDISFIEEMPLGTVGHDRAESFCSSDDILKTISREYKLQSVAEKTGGPSRYHALEGLNTRVGVISPHSNNFCDSCNRVRLTSEGRLLLCLGQEHSADLKALLRNGCTDADLENAIVDAMDIKPKGHDFTLETKPIILRHMSATGG